MFAENVWAEMKVVKQPQIYHLKPFSFPTRAQDLKWKQTFFMPFKRQFLLKIQTALALASGYDRSKKKKSTLKKNKKKERALKKRKSFKTLSLVI